jgi:hypothetical protein
VSGLQERFSFDIEARNASTSPATLTANFFIGLFFPRPSSFLLSKIYFLYYI